jgi:hypothetical protein
MTLILAQARRSEGKLLLAQSASRQSLGRTAVDCCGRVTFSWSSFDNGTIGMRD